MTSRSSGSIFSSLRVLDCHNPRRSHPGILRWNTGVLAVRWIAIVSWLVFLFLEIAEWVGLVYLERLGPDTSFGWTFLMLTGSHWIAAALCA